MKETYEVKNTQTPYVTKENYEAHCYACRTLRGDRDDHKCIVCRNNIYQETFYFDNGEPSIKNINYKGEQK